MSDTITAPYLENQWVIISPESNSEFAGRFAVVRRNAEPDASSVPVRVVPLDGNVAPHRVEIDAVDLRLALKEDDPRFNATSPEASWSDKTWFQKCQDPAREVPLLWNAQSITGGIAADTTFNATVDDQPVIAVWVEDTDSDDWARTYECFFADGSVEYVSPEDVDFGEDA